MAEITENTLTAYLGPEFQQRLMWQLLVEPEFAEKTIPDIAVEYFDDPNLKRLFIIILEYFKEFDKVPNLQNQSIHQAINKYRTPNNVIEQESLFAVIKRIELWNERVINKLMLHDGDAVQKSIYWFIKQQEYRKVAEDIITKVKNGEIKDKRTIAQIEEKFQKISHIGEQEDDCEELTEGIDKALTMEFRQPIATGIGTIDALTGGGLGKGEIGVILTPSGVGKTTALTVIANTAYEDNKNVAQIIFEDTKNQIKRKHYVIWADSALSKLTEKEENDRVNMVVHQKVKSLEGKGGRLVIKRFSQENTTIVDVRNWMLSYQKKYGFKFDLLVLDYLDCLESHKKSPDRNEAELTIIKGFEAISSDFDIPAWTAIQSNRSGFDAEFVEAHQSGGSIKRIQKAHFFMSVAKTPEQKEASLANIRIIKARFAQDGQTFTDCIFNNDTMKIIIEDDRYKNTRAYKGLKKHGDDDLNKVENISEKLKETLDPILESASEFDMHSHLSKYDETYLIDKVNSDAMNDTTAIGMDNEEYAKSLLEAVKNNELLDIGESTGDVVNEGETEGLTEGVIQESTENLLEITGDTITEVINIVEVKVEDLPSEGKLYEDKTPIVVENSRPIIPIHEKLQVHKEEDFELVDPDKLDIEQNSVFNVLQKARMNQDVIKKE